MGQLTLPADGLLLHIGPAKTGTTAIQRALAEARPALAEHGVCYPGTQSRQMRPGLAILGWSEPGLPEPTMQEWDELVREVRESADQRVCISTEDLGFADAEQARRVVEELGPERVHVVVTARRLDRLLPSQWQERVKNREVHSYPEWLSIVFGPESTHPAYQRFWGAQDLMKTYDAWAPMVGPERFTVIASDDSDRRLLHDTFEEMLGLPAGLLRSVSVNASLSAAAVELLRHVNIAAAGQEWADRDYRRLIRRGMGDRLRQLGTSEGSIPELPAWALARADEFTMRREEFFAARGVRVVGDLASLRISRHDAPDEMAPMPVTVPIQDAAAAVEGTYAGALLRLAEEERRHARVKRRLRKRVRELEQRLQDGRH